MRTLLLTLLALTSCCKERLVVFTEAVTYESLASYHVCTPDPRLNCPDRGQKLVISWFLPRGSQDAYIHAKIRFKNLEEIERIFPVDSLRGHVTYKLVNQDYCRTGGFLAYDIYLIESDQVVENTTHALWTELIEFPQ